MNKRVKAAKAAYEFVSTPGLVTLEPGYYLTQITKIVDDVSSEGNAQFVATFECTEGPAKGQSIRDWWNREGFRKDDDGNYILDENGDRIHDDENTEVCRRMIGQKANASGIPVGEGFNIDDLVGLKQGIVVATKLNQHGEPYNYVKSVISTESMRKRIERQSLGASLMQG